MTETLPFIKELKAMSAGVTFNTVAVLRAKYQKKTKAQKDFFSIDLVDSSGSFSANVWGDSAFFGLITNTPEGAVLKVSGKTDAYNGNFSPKVDSLSVVPDDQLGNYVSRLAEVSLLDPAQMSTDFAAFLDMISDEPTRKLVDAVFAEVGRTEFLSSPAARSMHHSWRSGLLEHTLTMLKLAKAIVPIYHPHIKFSRDVIIASIAMHDLCKVHEYTQGLSPQTTIRGRLLGHIALVYGALVKNAAALNVPQATTDAIGHVILSHHGKLEYGSPVVPSTPEAILVSMIDLLDSRMGALQASLRSDGDKPITPYNRALEAEIVLKVQG